MTLRACVASFLAIAMIGGCGDSGRSQQRPGRASLQERPTDPIKSARQAIGRGDFQKASQLIHQLLVTEPENAVALELAGDLALMGKDPNRALEFFELAMSATDKPSKNLLNKLGRDWMNVGRPFESVEAMKAAVLHYPDDADFRQKLVGLQSSLGMQWESLEHLQWLIQRGHQHLSLLMICSDITRPQTIESTCRYALKHYPDDLRPQYSLALLAAYKSDWDEVAGLLKPVIEKHPDFVQAQALYGRAIIQQADKQAIDRWVKNMPRRIEGQPQYWLAAGIWAEQNNDIRRAAHAYWRAVGLNENDSEALNRLSATLAQLGRSEQAKAAAERAARIADVRNNVDSLMTWRENSQSAAVKIAIALDQLGRRWEATTWLQAAFKMTKNKDPKLNDVYRSIRGKLTGTTPWQATENLVAANVDLSEFPVMDWRHRGSEAADETIAMSGARFRFADEASLRNLNHICELGKPRGEEADLAIYQSGAGGAGVIDFDLDGWPDVCLTVMDGTPKNNDSAPNRLFRNLRGQFADVTFLADVTDRGFAQGVVVGDYNSDGLADLFIANVGRNRIFRNNGDGTFRDATADLGLTGDAWTTSAAIADLDGDGHADLFEVGYCGGEKPYQQKCIDQQLGEPRSCAPLAFDPEQDRVWRGLGDGMFADVTATWLTDQKPGRGFGLVIGNLDHQDGVDIYVANDMTANHYWSPDSKASPFRLVEQATIRGLALNERSRSQASMGIAAGDADADGDIDFLLTHFFDDHNTFYEQVSPGMWADRSSRVGLAAPSQRMLGYGTQWIDVDNDGMPELFVANGDIDDFSYQNRPFRQRVQLFDRAADGRWRELNRTALGEYFAKDRLARAVVTLDANRDGKTDLLVTHLFDPVALLINETEGGSKQVRFLLRGTANHRDAVAAQINLKVGDREFVQQQLAGDGFQCANERCLTFGVGNADQVDDVTISWPGGTTEKLGSVAAGQDYLIVEGSGEVFAVSH